MPQPASKKTLMQLYHQAMIRTPAFHLSDQLSDCFDPLKEMIRDASPEFYQQIQHLSLGELLGAKDKKYRTVWKFFNRARYRAVPFGSFAAVSLVPVRTHAPDQHITLSSQIHITALRDWQDKDDLSLQIQHKTDRATLFITNSTIYRTAATYRYLYRSNGTYELGQVDSFEELAVLIPFCQKKRSLNEITEYLQHKFSYSAKRTAQLLSQLLDHQLLWTDKTPNLIGMDYFTRIGQEEIPPLKKVYKIAKRRHLAGALDEASVGGLPELFSFLNQNLPWTENTALTRFRHAFLKRYDQQRVPLSLALDPELGIGYAALGSFAGNGENQVAEIMAKETATQKSATQLNGLMLYILSRTADRDIIHLEEYNGPNENNDQVLPNTLSVMGYPWSNYQVIEYIGGCTANALIGRFTLCDPAIQNLGKELAAIEQQSNPDVAFFDVSFQAEPHVDNINRRQKLYQQELPLFCWSTDEEPLHTDDLWVSVEGQEIIIFSARLGKRLVPRITTAYNYQRSHLALYRFLSDLQHQGLRSALSLPLRRTFPGMDHYPRLMYKNYILSPRTWMVPSSLLRVICTSPVEGLPRLQSWLAEQSICTCFKCGSNDQTLTFNPADLDDLEAFMDFCRRPDASPVYLEEAFINQRPSVTNEKKQSYAPQLLLSYFHRQIIYQKPHRPLPVLPETLTRMLLPGSDWLYLEIYCHPARSNELLIRYIRPLMATAKQQIKQWFFIRYDKNGHHLRIRVQLKNPEKTGQLIAQFHRLLDPIIKQHWIADFQIKTYAREIERYGEERLPLIEQYFCRDSVNVAIQLSKLPDQDTLYHLALTTLHSLSIVAFPQLRQRLEFAEAMARQFSQKFNISTKAFKIINRHFEQFNRTQPDRIKPRAAQKHQKLVRHIFARCPESQDRHVLLADLVHMHINRLFCSDQQRHESLIYQYFMKSLKRLDKRPSSIKEC